MSLDESKELTSSLQEKLQKADSQLQSMNEDLNNSQDEISSLTSLKFDLERTIDECNDNFRFLKADYELICNNYKSLEQEKNGLKETISSLEVSLEDAGSRELNCQEEILAYKDQIKLLNDDLENKNSELAYNLNQLDELTKNVNSFLFLYVIHI